jgi:dihydropteroate synthase
MRIRGLELRFGARTYVMGIVNVTPDSFSGDGLLGGPERDVGASDEGWAAGATERTAEGVAERTVGAAAGSQRAARAAVEQAVRMVGEGADIIDVGGESTRPGHAPVSEQEELARVELVVRAIRARLPDVPLSIDTRKASVAEVALAAGVDILNDVAAVTDGARLASVAAAAGAPYILMHSRARPVYADVVAEVLADLSAALDRAEAAGCPRDRLIVDPGIGFGKTVQQNLALLRGLAALHALGRPILLGTSRKSTIGKVLDLPVDERLEGTLATTALGIAALVDIVRVHDVAANVRVARMSDAIIRAAWHETTAG